MPTYRLFYRDSGKIQGTDDLEATNDAEAVSLVHARKLPVSCEIWDRDRLAARVPAYQLSA